MKQYAGDEVTVVKIAVLSDIHGNYVALRKCLEHAKKQQIDYYLFLGDYLGEFPYPQETMKILYDMRKQYQCVFIRGNKEDYWINRRKGENCDWKDGNKSVGAMIYCYENLIPKDIDFFETLPISKSVRFGDCEPILICHGAPTNNRAKLLPDDDKILEAVNDCPEKYILCGHTHIQGIVLDAQKTILNPGAVGVSLHHQGKTQYMILHSEGSEWKPEFINLDYDVDRVVIEIHESGLWDITPYWCRITKHLICTGEISHGTVLEEVMRLNEYKDNWYDVPDIYWEEALKIYGI